MTTDDITGKLLDEKWIKGSVGFEILDIRPTLSDKKKFEIEIQTYCLWTYKNKEIKTKRKNYTLKINDTFEFADIKIKRQLILD